MLSFLALPNLQVTVVTGITNGPFGGSNIENNLITSLKEETGCISNTKPFPLLKQFAVGEIGMIKLFCLVSTH